MSAPPVPHLSAPLKLGDLTLRNRNVMASLTRNRSVPTNIPNEYNLEYYTQRAKGGAALILTEGTLVSQMGTEWPNAPGIWSEEHVAGWKKITDSVHDAGALIFCQLWHVGRVAHPDMEEQRKSGKPVFGPSAIAARGGKFRQLPGSPGYVTPTPIDDPWKIVEEFRHGAEMAKKAGFDGVELHSANGYIIHQFLDSTSNQRTDEWGGSVEGRCKLGLEVIKALVDVWGPARVGIKVNPCGGYNDMGMSLPDTIQTFTHYITQLAAMKIAYVQLMRYSAMMDEPLPPAPGETKGCRRGTPHDILAVYGPLIKTPPVILQEYSERAFRGPAHPAPAYDARNPTPTRLFLNCGLTPSEADKLIEEEKIDAAVFGYLWIGNPDLQKRLEKGMDVGGKGVNQQVDPTTFYGVPGVDPKKGYTDYPAAT